MSVATIVVIVIVAVVALLALGGYIANRRRFREEAQDLHARAREADQHLARAHAEHRGGARATLEDAARAASAERDGAPPAQLMLVQVVDRPGVDEDEAVFHADGERLVLGRTAAGWRTLG